MMGVGKPSVTDIMKQRDRFSYCCTKLDITMAPASLISVGCLKQKLPVSIVRMIFLVNGVTVSLITVLWLVIAIC